MASELDVVTRVGQKPLRRFVLRGTCQRAGLALSVALSLSIVGRVHAANPTAAEALTLPPMQKDAQIDRPQGDEIAKCTIKVEETGKKKTGYVVRDGQGQILRIFVDTNGDNTVDQWSFYKDGIEVYRDIDTNFNKKADQCRWLNTAGARWGIDTNEDGKIDVWKTISAEEVTAELVAALRDRDKARFERLLLSPKDLKGLGVGQTKREQLEKKLASAVSGFAKLAGSQKAVNQSTKWMSFGGTQPGLVPNGTDESTADVTVYENVMVMIETDSKPTAINAGAMVLVGDTWRLIDLPQMSEDSTGEATRFTFFPAPRNSQGEGDVVAKPNDELQKILDDFKKLSDRVDTTPAQIEERANYLEKIAKLSEGEARINWYHQLADTLSSSVQTNTYPGGLEKLKAVWEGLKADPNDQELAFYTQFRYMTAEHGFALANAGGPNGKPFNVINQQWQTDLAAFIDAAKKYPDSADAMLELAITQEFNDNEKEAIQWYDTIVKETKSTNPIHRRALGAKTRLTSVGNAIPLRGKALDGKPFDLAAMKGKVVLIQYWATWCEPCKSDMPLLKELRGKLKGFEVVGVCLDNVKGDMVSFLKENDPRWPQLYEEGGLDGRYAIELGIQTLPTMILIDKDGKVVDRNIRPQSLESEVKKLLK